MVAAEPQAARPPDRLLPLEGMRGLLAWWVVLGHFPHTVGLRLGLIENNGLAVDVFIILSGFVITMLIRKKREAYAPYLTRRAFRIFPAYLVVLLISAALLPVFADAMSNVPFQSQRNQVRLMQAEAALAWLPMHMAVHVPLLQGLVPASFEPNAAYTIVGQAWSVSLEWQFYLVAPLLVGLAASRRGLIALLVILTALLATKGLMSTAYLGAKIFQFTMGIASCIGFLAFGRRRLAAFSVAALAGVASIVVDGWMQIVPLTIWVGCMMTITGRGMFANAAGGLLSSPPLRWLGDRSYSVYLVHMIPLYLGVYVLNSLELASWAYAGCLFVTVVVGTLVLSVISYSGVERPCIRLGAALAKRLGTSMGARPALPGKEPALTEPVEAASGLLDEVPPFLRGWRAFLLRTGSSDQQIETQQGRAKHGRERDEEVEGLTQGASSSIKPRRG